MSAGSLQLTAKGQEDEWFTAHPERTFFQTVPPPFENKLYETLELPFDNQGLSFGKTSQCTIPVKGDYLTSLTLRTVLPAIYPQQSLSSYVYPDSLSGNLYAQMNVVNIVVASSVLTANTVGTHYFHVGSSVAITGNTYTVSTILTANSFTATATNSNYSAASGIVSTLAIDPTQLVGYYSTQNINLWAYNLLSTTWAISGISFSQSNLTVTTTTSSGFSVGQKVLVELGYIYNDTYTVLSATDKTFTVAQPLSNTFVAVTTNQAMYSTNQGVTWTAASTQPSRTLTSVTYGNSIFVAVSGGLPMYSTTGDTWILCNPQNVSPWISIAYGNGRFVAVSTASKAMYSTNGILWTLAASPPSGTWSSIAYGNGVFVAVSSSGNKSTTTTDGITWTSPVTVTGNWKSITYGNGIFMAVSSTAIITSTAGVTWTTVSVGGGTWVSIAYGAPGGTSTFVVAGASTNYFRYSTNNGTSWTTAATQQTGAWTSVTYGNGTFVAVSSGGTSTTSVNGSVWTAPVSTSGAWASVTYGSMSTYTPNNADLVYYSPLNVLYNSGQFTITSTAYNSIRFENARDAAFWGFDYKQGNVYSFSQGTINPPWTLIQGGWVTGILPPSNASYADSVANKLIKAARILVGKQVIKQFSGEYIELFNDLTVPYENKAILKLMNGTFDQTQAISAREYYVELPLESQDIPIYSLTYQNMSIEVDFEDYKNLSQNINTGSGSFTDPLSFVGFKGTLFNIASTISFQNYIYLLTVSGTIIVYNTNLPLTSQSSYVTFNPEFFLTPYYIVNFAISSPYIYLQTNNGNTYKNLLSDLNTGTVILTSMDSFGAATPVANMVCTALNLYRVLTSPTDVYVIQTLLTSPYTQTIAYLQTTIDSAISSVYQLISTGSQLIAITNTPGQFYVYNYNADFTTNWNLVTYNANQITSGVVIGSTVYFIADYWNIVTYTNGVFTTIQTRPMYSAVGSGGAAMYSYDSDTWTTSLKTPSGTWTSITSGGGLVAAVGVNVAMYSKNNGINWTASTTIPSGTWVSVTYGNGIFLAVKLNGAMYSTNANVWTLSTSVQTGSWSSVTYGNGLFVAVSTLSTAMYSTSGTTTWVTASTVQSGNWTSVTYGNGIFVAVKTNGAMYSTDGNIWILSTGPQNQTWKSVTYGNGLFVAVAVNSSMYSSDGNSWTSGSAQTGGWVSVSYGNGIFTAVASSTKYAMFSTDGKNWSAATTVSTASWTGVTYVPGALTQTLGTGFTNLLAVGSSIYASSDAYTFKIDTTQNLSSSSAYQYSAPIIYDGTKPKIFAYGPRYVYMFTNDPSQTTTPQYIYQYDPYVPNPSLQATILAKFQTGNTRPTSALIGIVQTQKVTSMSYLDIRGPVKELWITGTSNTTNVFQYSNLSDSSTLTLTSKEAIITPDVGTKTYLSVIEPFETHTSTPNRNFSVVPFELDPESESPNGTVNFSRISDQVFTGGAQTVWARSYNILKIHGGVGGLMFNSSL